MVQLALGIARRIVHREVTLDQDLLIAMARVALQRLGDSATVTVRLHPEEYAATAGQQEARFTGTNVTVVADARVVVLEGHRPRIAALVVPSLQGHSKLAEIGKLAFNRMLRDTLSQFIEPVGIPRIWRYLDALPINAQGKVTRADLIAVLERKTPRPTMPLERLIERDAQRAVFEFTARSYGPQALPWPMPCAARVAPSIAVQANATSLPT